MAETERQLELVPVLGNGPVADPLDLEFFAETLGHAEDHVLDQRAHQAVKGLRLAAVIRALDHQNPIVGVDGDSTGQLLAEGALGACDRD